MSMKNLSFIIFLLATLCCGSTGVAQQTKILTADKHNEYGLIYKLPITSLEIEVEAIRKVYKAGPYYQYAKKYLGLTDVITENYETWEITGVDMRPIGIADDSEEYLMQLKSNSVSYLNVNRDGILLAINREIQLPETEQIEQYSLSTSTLDTDEYLKYVTGDFLASQSSSKRAQILAESLMEIREAKISLSRGTAETMPTDGHQLELMLASLAQQEQAITDAFAGTIQTQKVVRKFSYTPSPDTEGSEILFRMSDFAGFVAADDYSGDPVKISVEITRQGELPADEKGEEKRLPKDAVIYNIPGAAVVTLSFNGVSLFEHEFEFAQFGVKFGLNPSLFNSKKDPSYLILDATTGGIRQLGSNSSEE